MEWTKEKYLDAINNAPLFDIEDETSDDYATEYRYLQTVVSEYYLKCLYKKVDKDGNVISFKYGLELMEKYTECIKSYNKEKGLFSTYLDFSFNQAIKKSKGIEQSDAMRGGMIKSSTQKEIRTLVNIVANKGWDLDDIETAEKLSYIMVKPLNKIKELLDINRKALVQSEFVSVHDEEVSLFDSIADDEKTAEQLIIDKENLISELDKIDVFIKPLSASKHQVASAILTSIVTNLDFEKAIGISKLQEYSFFSKEIYDLQVKQENRMTDVEIAKILGKTKPYISKVKTGIIELLGGLL